MIDKNYLLALALLASSAVLAAAPLSMGMTVIHRQDHAGPITVFYPSSSAAQQLKRGFFNVHLAAESQPVAGNQRLVVFSHGSGGSPWPMSDLARSFVKAGFIVAVPEHQGDNYRNMKLVGPSSWKLRPKEVSQAIDALQQDSRFASLIDFERVGVYGLSAGGLTALVLAGGTWSPANFKRHCIANMRSDFPACVGLATQLTGRWTDAIKLTVAGWVHRLWFGDETPYTHQDPRVKAVLAAVPVAAPFDMTSLAQPKIAVGLIAAEQDQWLAPRMHVRAVQAACTGCAMVLDLPHAGHGSLFSPWPVEVAQSQTPLLLDPPGFDRSELPELYKKMVAFFVTQLNPP